MPRHDCTQTRLCPGTLVPQHELLWSDTIMSLVNNNTIISIIKVAKYLVIWLVTRMNGLTRFLLSLSNCVHKINFVPTWLVKTQACPTVVGETKRDYLTSVQQSPAVFLQEYFVIVSLSGYQICVWAQTYMFLPRHDCDYTIITCQGTNVSGHKRVWAQSCLGTIVSGHNRVWALSCLGTIVSGHNRV